MSLKLSLAHQRKLEYSFNMQRIPLTRGAYALVDDEDLEDLSQYKWQLSNPGYASRHIPMTDGKNIGMHRHLMNPPKHMEVDHINGNKLDNQRANLRIVTHATNMKNVKVHKDSKSGIRGVYWDNTFKRWKAQLCVDGVRYNLGTYLEKHMAIEARHQGELTYMPDINQG